MIFDALGTLAIGEIPFVAIHVPGGRFPRRIIRQVEEDDELAALLLAWYHIYE